MCSSHVHDIFLNVYLYLANKTEIKGIGNKEKSSYSKGTLALAFIFQLQK